MEKFEEKINTFWKTFRRMPTYSEMMDIFSYKTKSAVHYTVNKLIARGFIKKDKKGKLIPDKFFQGTKVLGLVEAGFPSPAEEELADTLSLDDYLIDNRNASYILKVKGDSMVDAGIYEGDMVIVERGKKPKNGDIVIAEIDGEYTMKYFRQNSGGIYLEPANSKYPILYPKDELVIIAVVKVIIRKY